MRTRFTIPARNAAPILDEAVRNRSLAIVCAQTQGTWQSLKARFLECDQRQRFFVLDYQPTLDAGPQPALTPGQCVGISFRHGSSKILLATVVEARGHFIVDDRHTVAAVRYRWPETMTEMQRRAYLRTLVPPGLNLPVSIWPGGLPARVSAQAGQCRVVHGSLVDVSCGGALIRLAQATAPDWGEDQVLGLEMQLGDGKPPLAAECRSRGIRHEASGQLCVAVQFMGLELTVDGGLALQRLAATVQRFRGFGSVPGRSEGLQRQA